MAASSAYYTMSGVMPAPAAPATRFTPADFKYNGRVALALLPCLLTVATIGGADVLACLTVGAMVVYLMDSLQYREGAFTCAWLTLAAADVAFAVSLLSTSDAPVLLQLCMLFAMLFLSVLTGMWASLQFKWLQMQYPAAAIYFERCVLTASLPLAAIIHCLGLATFVPYTDVPYYLAVVMVMLYYLLGRPLMSSFYNVKAGPAALGGGTGVGPEAVVQTCGDGVLMAALVIVLPTATYAAVHWVVLFFPFHIYAMLLLGGGLPLCLALLPGGLWWLAPAMPPPVNVSSSGAAAAAQHASMYGTTPYVSTPTRGLPGMLRRLIISGALLLALVGFEGRVVFHGFGQYIQLPPPWNWLAVTFALFGCAVVGLAHLTGALGVSVDVTVAGSFLLLCTTAGALAAGVPFAWLPAPLLAACGLSLFYESRHLREYLVFVVGAFLTCLWFVRQHFWFLDIPLSGFQLYTVCKMAVAALVPALLVPGLVIGRVSGHIVGGLLVLQAVLLCVMEEALFSAGQGEGAAEPMYPGYLVLSTSLLGLSACRLLTGRGRLTPATSWLLHALYIAKAAMLLIPEAALVVPTALLSAATLAPYFMHGPSWLNNSPVSAAGGGAGGSTGAAAAGGLLALAPEDIPEGGGVGAGGAGMALRTGLRPRRVRLAPWQGLLHILSVLVCLGLARFAVFDAVQFLLAARPSEGLLLGSLLVVCAVCLVPLVMHCYGGRGALVRVVAGVALVGCLLAALQPPLPLAGGARCPHMPLSLSLCPRLWDERHVPMHSAEDVEVWGRGLSRREHWPRWLLVAAVVAGMVVAGGGGGGGVPGAGLMGAPAGPGRRGVAARVGLGAAAGVLVGAYTALELLPGQVPLQVLVTASSVCAVVFVVLLALPAGGGPLAAPGLALLWATCSGLALLLHAELPVPLGAASARLFPDSKMQVEREIYRATKAALLAVVASHALLMAFSLKLKMSSALRRRAAAAAAGSRDSSAATASFGISPSDLLCGLVPAPLFANYCTMLRLEGAGALALQRLAAEGQVWVPCLGNMLTLTAAVLGLALNSFLAGDGGLGLGAPEAIFMLAPVLLLLSQDPLILPFLSERQRYFPPQLAISGYLLVTGLAGSVADALTAGGAAAAAVGLSPTVYLAKEVLLAALAVPHHLLCLQYLWTLRPRPSMYGALALSSLVCVLPAAMCDVAALRLFGAVGCVVAVLQHFSMKHVRHVGMKVI